MNTAVLVASRELRDRSRLFIVAAALAVIPFLVAAVPAARSARGSAIAMVAGVLSLAFAASIALALGVSTIGRELTEKRLSFYFSRPISPAAIWIGKAVSAMVTVYAVALIVALPAYFAATKEWTSTWLRSGSGVLAFLAVMPLALFLVSHALSTMIRSRSLLIALDFVLSVIAAMAILYMLRPVLLGAGEELAKSVLIAYGIALLAILAVVPIGQLAYGRTDIRRSHAALARFLWPAIGVTLAIGGLFVFWLTSASVDDLDDFYEVRQNATGEWLLVEGIDNKRLGFTSSFVVNTVTGERQRMRMPSWWNATFSRDGRVLSWLEPTSLLPRNPTLQLYVRRLDRARDGDFATRVTMPIGASYVLSDDGSRVAISHGTSISVVDLESGRMIAAAKAFDAHLMWFVSGDRVRLVEHGSLRDTWRIGELDIARRSFQVTGAIKSSAQIGGASVSADGSLLYVPSAVTVFDGRTGRQVGVLPTDMRGVGSRMLSDGTIVGAVNNAIRRFDANGRELQRLATPMKRGAVLAEIGRSKVLLGWMRGMQIVDLERGVAEGYVSGARGGWGWSRDPRIRRFEPNASVNYVQQDGAKRRLAKMKTAS